MRRPWNPPPAASEQLSPARQPRWRRFRLVVATVATLVGLGVIAQASPAAASADAANCDPDNVYVLIIQATGRLDPVLVDYLDSQIKNAADDGGCAVWAVLQLNSSGAAGNEDGLNELLGTLRSSSVPVAVWVGPSGNQATGEAVDLLAVADKTGMAPPNAHIEVTPALLAARGLDAADLGNVDVGDRVSAERAKKLDLVDDDSATIVDFVGRLDGVESKVTDGDKRQVTTEVHFSKLPISGQLMHTVSSPAVAYLLFVIGLALLVFELFTAGVGIAGMVGAGSLMLGCYGLASLPTRPLGVALLLLAMFGYAIDVQTGVPRVWSGIATGAFALGSLLLFDGVSVSWITLLVAIAGMTLAMLSGMPTMVRSRFSTPTIGREWMVGEIGTARTAISPDGIVIVRDAPWRARTNRATPIGKDEAVRVVAIEGLVLEVEPESGGAKDYRERAKQRS